MHGTIRQEFQLESDAFRRSGRIQHYGAFLVRIAFLLDTVVLYTALYLSVRMNTVAWQQRYVTLALLGIVVFGLVGSFRDLHRSWRLEPLRKELVELSLVLTASLLVVAALLAVGTSWGLERPHGKIMAGWWAISLSGVACARTALRVVLLYWRAGSRRERRVAFYGATHTAQLLVDRFARHPWMGFDPVGIFDERAAHRLPKLEMPVAGDLDALVALAREERISGVFITLRMASEARVQEIVDRFADTTVSLHYCPALYDLDLLGGRWDDVFGVPVVTVVASPFDGIGRHFKRLEDLVVTLLILPFALLPGLLIAAAVKLTSRGPALYLQARYGQDGRPFKIRKFRTMHTLDSDAEFVQAKRNDSRITPLGAFLRRTSLDELPQLINVLRGEMSLVGPRPAPVKYNEDHRRIIRRYMLRHKVKPGITGLAQVNGCRGETETLDKTERRTAYDLQYIDRWSLWLDIKILFRTAGQVLWDFKPR